MLIRSPPWGCAYSADWQYYWVEDFSFTDIQLEVIFVLCALVSTTYTSLDQWYMDGWSITTSSHWTKIKQNLHGLGHCAIGVICSCNDLEVELQYLVFMVFHPISSLIKTEVMRNNHTWTSLIELQLNKTKTIFGEKILRGVFLIFVVWTNHYLKLGVGRSQAVERLQNSRNIRKWWLMYRVVYCYMVIYLQ